MPDGAWRPRVAIGLERHAQVLLERDARSRSYSGISMVADIDHAMYTYAIINIHPNQLLDVRHCSNFRAIRAEAAEELAVWAKFVANLVHGHARTPFVIGLQLDRRFDHRQRRRIGGAFRAARFSVYGFNLRHGRDHLLAVRGDHLQGGVGGGGAPAHGSRQRG